MSGQPFVAILKWFNRISGTTFVRFLNGLIESRGPFVSGFEVVGKNLRDSCCFDYEVV